MDRGALAKMRLSAHKLEIERGRYAKIDIEKKGCVKFVLVMQLKMKHISYGIAANMKMKGICLLILLIYQMCVIVSIISILGQSLL